MLFDNYLITSLLYYSRNQEMQSRQIEIQNANGYFWFLLSNKKHICQFDILWTDSITGENLANPVYSEECIKDVPCLLNFETVLQKKLTKCPCCSALWRTMFKDSLLSTIANQTKDIKKTPLYIRFKDSSWSILGPKMQYHPFDWVVLETQKTINLWSKKQIKKPSKNKIITIQSYDQSCLCAVVEGKVYITNLDHEEATNTCFIYKNQEIKNWKIAVIHNGVFVGCANGMVYTSQLLHQRLTQNSFQLTFGIQEKQCKELSIFQNDLWTTDEGGIVKHYSNFLYSFENATIRKDLNGKILINEQGEVISISSQNDNIIVHQPQQQIQIDVGEHLNLQNYGLLYSGSKAFLFSYKSEVSSLEICLQPSGIKKIKTKICKPLSQLQYLDIICRYIDEDLKLKELLLKS